MDKKSPASPDKKTLKSLVKQAEAMHKDDEDYKKAENRDFVLYLIMVVVIALAVRLFIAEPVRVDGDSMFPTLINGERMFVEKVSYCFERPKRGDIVICYYPNHAVTCVKRVVGLPGETVDIMDGRIFINGEELDESAYWNDYILGYVTAYTVPEDSIFVVGDNRNASKDSRNTGEVGAIPYCRVVGRARSVIWPVDRARGL